MRKVPDPYRVLGVGRGADAAQIKAAHRRLAKRHHPDAPGGDEDRFLAIQEAYQLLSDPLRRRDWDRDHAPAPVDARDRGTRASARATSSRWTREDASGYRRTRPARHATGGARRDEDAARSAPFGSGRDPRTRRATWSAEGVPWWEDFTPHARAHATTPEGASAGPRPPHAADAAEAGAAPGEAVAGSGAASWHAGSRGGGDMDAYVRSSGAAWSSAARRHFRRDEATLPSRGAFRYRGTQVVTGAEARKVAAEEAAAREAAAAALFRRARPEGSTPPPPRQAFDHEAPPSAPAPDPTTSGDHRPEPTSDAPSPAAPTRAPMPDLVTSAAASERGARRPVAPAEAARVHEGSPASRRRVATAIGALAGAAAAGLPALAMVSSEVPGPSIVLVAAGALAGALLGWALRRPDAAP